MGSLVGRKRDCVHETYEVICRTSLAQCHKDLTLIDQVDLESCFSLMQMHGF